MCVCVCVCACVWESLYTYAYMHEQSSCNYHLYFNSTGSKYLIVNTFPRFSELQYIKKTLWVPVSRNKGLRRANCINIKNKINFYTEKGLPKLVSSFLKNYHPVVKVIFTNIQNSLKAWYANVQFSKHKTGTAPAGHGHSGRTGAWKSSSPSPKAQPDKKQPQFTSPWPEGHDEG